MKYRHCSLTNCKLKMHLYALSKIIYIHDCIIFCIFHNWWNFRDYTSSFFGRSDEKSSSNRRLQATSSAILRFLSSTDFSSLVIAVTDIRWLPPSGEGISRKNSIGKWFKKSERERERERGRERECVYGCGGWFWGNKHKRRKIEENKSGKKRKNNK